MKEMEPDDPMELVMVAMSGGDPQFMATCIIEEYARLGMDEEEIFRLFSQPIYQTHAFYRQFGEAWIRDLIREVLSRTSQFKLRIAVGAVRRIGLRNEKSENPQSAIRNPKSEEGGV